MSAVGRALTALPDRLLLLLFWTCLVVAVATTAEVFTPAVVLLAAAVVVAATWRLAPVPLARTATWPVDAAAAVVLLVLVGAWVALNVPYVATALVPLRDPGFLTLAGVWLTDHPSPDMDPGGALDVALNRRGLFGGGGALTLAGGMLHVQGSPVLPGLLALGGWAGGTSGVLVSNLVLGALALVGVFAFTRRLAGSAWALVPTVALGASLPMLAFSRGTYTEPVVAALVLAGLVMTWSGLAARRTSHLALGAAMVASGSLVRIDGAAVLVGLLGGTALVVATTTLPHVRRRLRRAWFAMVLCAGLVLALGLLTLRLHSPGYLNSLSQQIAALLTVLAVTAAVGAALVLIPLGPVRRWLVRRRHGLGWAVGTAVAALGGVLLSRPLWLVERNIDPQSAYGSVVLALQRAAGLPEDAARSYDEQSLTWIAWYLGWPAVLLALIGLAVLGALAVRRPDPGLLVVLAVVAAPSLLYLVRMSITPDHVWALRRFVPVTLPGLLVVATWLLSTLWPRRTAGTGGFGSGPLRWAGRAALLGLAATVVVAPVLTWGPVVRSAEYPGQREQVEAVCAQLDDAGISRVVHVNSGVPYLTSLRLVCDVTVVEVRHAPSSRLLERIDDDWAGPGPVGVVTFDFRLLPWSRDPGPALSSITTGIWEQTLVRVPQEMVTWEQSVWVGRLLPDGTIDPLS